MPSTLSQQTSLESEKDNSREQQNDDEDYPWRMIQREVASHTANKLRLNVWLPTSQFCLPSWPKPSEGRILRGLQGFLEYDSTYLPSCLLSSQNDTEADSSQGEQDLKLIMTVTSLISPHPGIGQRLYKENKGHTPRDALHRLSSELKLQTQDFPGAGTIQVLHIESRSLDKIEKFKPSPTVEDRLKLAIDMGVYLRRWNICPCPQDQSPVTEIAQKYAAVYNTDEIHNPVAI
ncbi:hypothetical protein BFJ71_g16177 [Fusarium oxysporum]|nr:hypothetical protein BFJ71_g16177 [Fusarium oxysporum]